MLKPPDLIGHVSLTLNPGNTADIKDMFPLRVVSPFQRIRDAKSREKHEVGMMLPTQETVRSCHKFESISPVYYLRISLSTHQCILSVNFSKTTRTFFIPHNPALAPNHQARSNHR